MLSSSLLAQQATNAPAPAPIENPAPAPALTNPAAATATSSDAQQSGKKKSTAKKKNGKAAAKKPAATVEVKTTPLTAGPAVVDANNVNVRGQAKLNSEVVTRLTKGQAVTVLEEVTLKKSAPDEPSAWAKIVLPPTAHVWVNTAFIDATNKTVLPRRLNVRSGPGENYSVLGRLERGEAVKEVGTKNTWTEIEAPTNAYAFVAAQYLKQEAAGTTPPPIAIAAAPEPAPTPAPTAVTEPPAIAAPATDTPVTSTPTVTNAPAEPPAMTNAPTEVAAAPAEPAVEEPPPKRIVQREGIVRGTVSIQAPSRFGLVSPDNNRLMDYLHTTSRGLDLNRYKGMRIIVTGEEGLDERWGNTPVLTIQKIQVLE